MDVTLRKRNRFEHQLHRPAPAQAAGNHDSRNAALKQASLSQNHVPILFNRLFQTGLKSFPQLVLARVQAIQQNKPGPRAHWDCDRFLPGSHRGRWRVGQRFENGRLVNSQGHLRMAIFVH